MSQNNRKLGEGERCGEDRGKGDVAQRKRRQGKKGKGQIQKGKLEKGELEKGKLEKGKLGKGKLDTGKHKPDTTEQGKSGKGDILSFIQISDPTTQAEI